MIEAMNKLEESDEPVQDIDANDSQDLTDVKSDEAALTVELATSGKESEAEPKDTGKTSEGRSATFRVQGLFFLPQLLHDISQHFFQKNFFFEPSWGEVTPWKPLEASLFFFFF